MLCFKKIFLYLAYSPKTLIFFILKLTSPLNQP